MWDEIPPFALWLFGLAAFGCIFGPIIGYYLGLCSQREAAKREAKVAALDRKSTRLNSSHRCISYAVFCLTNTGRPNSVRTLSQVPCPQSHRSRASCCA